MSILSIQTVWAVNQTIQVRSQMLNFPVLLNIFGSDIIFLPSYEHYFITSSLNLHELTIAKLIRTRLTDVFGKKSEPELIKAISSFLITFSCSSDNDNV